MSEELKPCPFCGTVAIGTGKLNEILCKCRVVNMATEKWNSAHCWKEISDLQRKLAEEKQKVEAYREVAKNQIWATTLDGFRKYTLVSECLEEADAEAQKIIEGKK